MYYRITDFVLKFELKVIFTYIIISLSVIYYRRLLKVIASDLIQYHIREKLYHSYFCSLTASTVI